jgi:hypothetical protein
VWWHRGGRNGFQRIRDIPVAGAVEAFWSKYRWYCQEPERASVFL